MAVVNRWVWWAEFLIPVLIAFPFLFKIIIIDPSKPTSQCLGITIITACWWIFEPVSITVTAFIPIFALPFFAVSKARDIAASLFTDTTLVFLGGFIFSIAMERWNLHSRIALKTVLIFGLRPNLLLLGICLVTAFLSMWISNTATALTMVPNALAIIKKIEEITGDPEGVAPFGKALFLGIAFSAGIGGMATLIGTPPNLILAQVAKSQFPNSPSIGFGEFMMVAFPLSAVLLIIMYFYFVFVYMRKVKFPPNIDDTIFKENYEKLGPMSIPEKIVSIMFVLLALMWLFRGDLNLGTNFTIKGWSTHLYGSAGSSYIQDGTVALFLSVIMFLIYVPDMGKNDPKNKSKSDSSDGMEEEDHEIVLETIPTLNEPIKWVPLIEWEPTQQKIPWSILFLFAGGFALNQGFKDSAFDKWIGDKLKSLTDLPLFVLVLGISAVTSALSNIASNTACANIVLPIVAAVAKNTQKYHPWLLMFPAAFATSICFILPIATPPNLICLGSGKLVTSDFMKGGSAINIISIIVMSLLALWLVQLVFDANSFPIWAKP